MIDIRRNIEKVYQNKNPFWGKYAELNSAVVPSIGMIQNFQLQKIQMYQDAASSRVSNKNSKINALFTSGNINSLPSAYEGEEDVQLDRAITSIVGMLNGTYKSNKTNANPQYNYDQMQRTLQSLVRSLAKLNATIVANGGKSIPGSYIMELEACINACNISSLSDGVLDEWFKHLNKFKGDLVEDIGVAWLSAIGVPNVETLNTGALNYQGSGKYGRKGQLIQDLMTLSVSDIDLDNIPIEYKDLEGKTVKTSLRDFIAAMERAGKEHKQISLYDSGYETLLNLSTLNIQAKSGINQLPWNESKSTSVSIGEFSNDDGLSLSTKHAFELLHELDQDNTPQKDIWVKDSSNDYNLMADYGLATVLFKVLHLEENGNDYVLTPQGFTSFTDRIAELMRKKNSRVTLKEQVTINDNTLSTIYNVSMVGYKR